MKKIITLSILLVLSIISFAQRLLTDDFNYNLGQLTLTAAAGTGNNVSGGAWVWSSGTANFLPVVAGTLDYPGYVTGASATNNNKLSLVAALTSAEDAYTQFATQPSTNAATVYVSFLLNVRDTINLTNNLTTGGLPSNGEYFAGFLPSTNTNSYNSGRVYIKKGSAGNTFALGTSPAIATTTPVFYSPVDYALNTTHLVTLAYVIVPGANNDTSKLFVNKPFSATEPLPDAVSPYTAAAAVESVDVSRFFIRQAATSGRTTPNADLDGIKISLNYADAALPLTLTSFKARLVEKFVQLNWTSVNEENVRSYTIERSNDGRNFASIGQVSASNTSQASYLFSDNAPIQGIGYYRLKMTDNDGDTKLSAIVSINSRKKISAEVYPNPVVDNISVSHSKAAIGASIKIYNTSGQQVKSVTVQPGTIQTSLLVNELIKGNYVLAFDNDGESTVTKFIKK